MYDHRIPILEYYEVFLTITLREASCINVETALKNLTTSAQTLQS
jgi:hypothetical protein